MWKRNVIYCYKVINQIVSTKILVIRTNLTPTKVQTLSNLYIRKLEIVPRRKAEVVDVQSPGKSKTMVNIFLQLKTPWNTQKNQSLTQKTNHSLIKHILYTGYEKSNSNNVGTESNQSTTSNGCQSDYYSVENSSEHFTDQSGVDLLQFFKITLNKNAKDRFMLLRIEKELAALTQDQR